MKKLTFLLTAALPATAIFAATVDGVTCRQNWPWSNELTVTYTVSGVESGKFVDATLTAYRGDSTVTMDDQALTGDYYAIGNGTYTVKIDPAKAFGAGHNVYNDFKIRVTVAEATTSTEVLYKIFDLSSGACTDVTRADILNGKYGSYETNYGKIGNNFTTTLDDVLIWTGVTNNPVYKTSKLVMRKINAANKTWLSGDPSGAYCPADTYARKTQYWVKLTYDYYIAVFELTLAQCKYIQTWYPSSAFKADDEVGTTDYTYRTACNFNVFCEVMGGHKNSETTNKSYFGALTGEPINYPTNSYVRDVSSASVCGRMCAKAKSGGLRYEFTLPNVAEWEYACMGGNTSALYSGLPNNVVANVAALGYYNDTNESYVHMVGEKACNAYGLYDMLGNVSEWLCGTGAITDGAESGTGASKDDPVVNPTGKATGDAPYNAGACWCNDSNTRYKGCGHYGAYYSLRHAGRHNGWIGRADSRPYIGVRLVMPATANGQWADHPTK